MIELELARVPRERRLYRLGGIGTIRLEGPFGRRATAAAGGRHWCFARRGFWQRAIEATDAAGSVVGGFRPRDIRRGGTLRWGARELALQPVSLRERYVLNEGERDVVLLDGKGWGRRPVEVTLADPGGIDPGLLLFAVFVVHLLAGDSVNGSSAGSAAVMGTGAYG